MTLVKGDVLGEQVLYSQPQPLKRKKSIRPMAGRKNKEGREKAINDLRSREVQNGTPFCSILKVFLLLLFFVRLFACLFCFVLFITTVVLFRTLLMEAAPFNIWMRVFALRITFQLCMTRSPSHLPPYLKNRDKISLTVLTWTLPRQNSPSMTRAQAMTGAWQQMQRLHRASTPQQGQRAAHQPPGRAGRRDCECQRTRPTLKWRPGTERRAQGQNKGHVTAGALGRRRPGNRKNFRV